MVCTPLCGLTTVSEPLWFSRNSNSVLSCAFKELCSLNYVGFYVPSDSNAESYNPLRWRKKIFCLSCDLLLFSACDQTFFSIEMTLLKE